MSKTPERGTERERSTPEITFKRELEALRAQRRVPSFARHCTIGGEIERAVHTELDKERERRISFAATRLREMKGHIENAYGCAQLKNRVCWDFERSR